MKNQKTEATERPWRVEDNCILGADGRLICTNILDEDETHTQESMANHELAVRAVNNHESLLEARRLAKMEIENHLADRHHQENTLAFNSKTNLEGILKVLRSTIANATK